MKRLKHPNNIWITEGIQDYFEINDSRNPINHHYGLWLYDLRRISSPTFFHNLGRNITI